MIQPLVFNGDIVFDCLENGKKHPIILWAFSPKRIKPHSGWLVFMCACVCSSCVTAAECMCACMWTRLHRLERARKKKHSIWYTCLSVMHRLQYQFICQISANIITNRKQLAISSYWCVCACVVCKSQSIFNVEYQNKIKSIEQKQHIPLLFHFSKQNRKKFLQQKQNTQRSEKLHDE